MDILDDCEKRALVSLDGQVDFTLKDKGQKRQTVCGSGYYCRLCRRRF